MSYLVRVVEMTVSEWCAYEGAGDYLFTKGGFEVGTYNTLEECKKAIEEQLGYELTDADDYGDDYITGTRIENEDAYADENGRFIVDYVFTVDEIKRVSLF